MKLFKNWYADYKLLKKENQYYTTECWVKEEKIRELKKENRELRKEIEVLKCDRKTTGRKHNTRKQSGIKRDSE